jgi:hypothetical protein
MIVIWASQVALLTCDLHTNLYELAGDDSDKNHIPGHSNHPASAYFTKYMESQVSKLNRCKLIQCSISQSPQTRA